MNNVQSSALLVLLVSFISLSFQLPEKIQKKVDKEIKLIFNTDEFVLEPVIVSDDINAKLRTKINENDLFNISTDDVSLGYAYLGKGFGKVDDFDFLVLFDTNLIIVKSKILVYREDYGGEIGSKRWLKQFNGKGKNDNIEYEKDIIAISGATLSAKSMTVAMNNLLKTITILHNNKAI